MIDTEKRRAEISTILAEIEANPVQIHDSDAQEAIEIIELIENKLAGKDST